MYIRSVCAHEWMCLTSAMLLLTKTSLSNCGTCDPHMVACAIFTGPHTHTHLHTQTETHTHKSLNIVVAIWQAVSSFIQHVNIHPDKLYARTPAPLCLLLKAAFLKANYQCLGIEMGQRLAWLSSRHTDPLLPVLVRRHSRQAHTCRHTDRHTHTEFHL